MRRRARLSNEAEEQARIKACRG